MGMASAIVTFITVVINLTMTPAALMCFNSFFMKAVLPWYCCGRLWKWGAVVDSVLKTNQPAYFNPLGYDIDPDSEQNFQNFSHSPRVSASPSVRTQANLQALSDKVPDRPVQRSKTAAKLTGAFATSELHTDEYAVANGDSASARMYDAQQVLLEKESPVSATALSASGAEAPIMSPLALPGSEFRDELEQSTFPSPAPNRVSTPERYTVTGGSVKQQSFATVPKAGWLLFGELLTAFPFSLFWFLIVLVITLPVDVHAPLLNYSSSLLLFLPRQAPSTAAFKRLDALFGVSVLYPYRLLFQAPLGEVVLSPQFFSSVQEILTDVSLANPHSVLEVEGLLFNKSFDMVTQCLSNPTSSPYCQEVAFEYQEYVSSLPGEEATWLRLTLRADPLNSHGAKWLSNTREALAQSCARDWFGREAKMACSISGVPADNLDSMTAVYGLSFIVVTLNFILIFILGMFFFKSILIPLRWLLTCGLTGMFVYGMAVMVYQNGLLIFLNFPALAPSTGDVHWTAPVMSFFLMLGWALDYDIFVLVHIQQSRRAGLDTRDAIIQGLLQSGSIITTSSSLIALSFASLLLSDIPILNQLVFFLVLSVIFDTFLARLILTPIFMSIFGDANWWPGSSIWTARRKQQYLLERPKILSPFLIERRQRRRRRKRELDPEHPSSSRTPIQITGQTPRIYREESRTKSSAGTRRPGRRISDEPELSVTVSVSQSQSHSHSNSGRHMTNPVASYSRTAQINRQSF